MVCRENKGRSAAMGYEKHMLRQMGFKDYRDFEVQSSIHEYGHTYSGAANPSRTEQEAFLLGFRQQVVNDDTIGDGDKFRVSDRQPGLVTRIDQELARVRTGLDENGRPLTSAQRNEGKHFASMKRLGVLMARQQAAKQSYVETYARTTGVTTHDARSRWDALVSRSAEERKNTKVSLTDDWQQRLNVNGVTSQQQADIGQSNVAREALRIMESERQAKIRTLPTRPAVTAENRQSFLRPDDPKIQIRCDGCGQFGHEEPACPNAAEVEAVRRATETYEERINEAQRHQNAAHAQNELRRLENGEPVGFDINNDGTRYVLDPRTLRAVRADSDEAPTLLREVAASGDPSKADEAAGDAKAAGVYFEMAQDALEEKRGPIPSVSAAVQDIGYNADSGVLEVTAHPYTRKRTGEVVPAKTYVYRVSPREYDEMMASGSPGKYASNHFFGRRGNDKFRFENEAEEREARVQRQCPSCGQFAAMTAAHQCPISGSMNSKEEAAYRDRLRLARDEARLTKLPVSPVDSTPRHRVDAVSNASLADGGFLRFPERTQMVLNRDRGKVALGGFTGQYLGARVTGRVYTWAEPGSGQTLSRVDNVKCSCGGPPCRHTEKAADLMAVTYGAKTANGVRPGGRRFLEDAPAASDAPAADFDRTPYDKIRQTRSEAAATQNRVFIEHPERRTVASWPIDAATGQPRYAPPTWENGDRQVSVNDAESSATEIQANLTRATGAAWNVRTESDGSLRISAPPTRTRGGKMSDHDQSRLAAALGLRSGRTGGSGVHVPADPSWRHEFLDRSAGRPPTVLGSRFVVRRPHEAAGPQA